MNTLKELTNKLDNAGVFIIKNTPLEGIFLAIAILYRIAKWFSKKNQD